MIDRLELNTKAQELRERLGEDANSPVDVFALLNRIEKLTLVLYPLGDHISGMCLQEDGLRLLAVNSAMSYGRQRYSVAHELYHLYFDDARSFYVCARKLDQGSENERSADQFASYFLAPYKALREEVRRICGDRKPSLPDVIALEQEFGMSHQAMLVRLVSENRLTRADADGLSTGVVRAALELGFEEKLYRPLPEELQKRTYGYYLQQVEQLRRKDLVSEGKIDELLLDAFRSDIAFCEESVREEEID